MINKTKVGPIRNDARLLMSTKALKLIQKCSKIALESQFLLFGIDKVSKYFSAYFLAKSLKHPLAHSPQVFVFVAQASQYNLGVLFELPQIAAFYLIHPARKIRAAHQILQRILFCDTGRLVAGRTAARLLG